MGRDNKAGVRGTARQRKMRDAAVSKTADIRSEDQRPCETAARGPRVAPRVPRWQASGAEWHGADSPARPAPGGPPGRTELPGEALLSAGVPPGSGAGCRSVRVSHPCRELAQAQCRANSLTPAGRGQRAQGVCLHIAKANVRHLKRQSPLKVLQVCTAGRRASNTCGPNRQTHVAGGDSTPFSHGPQCG